MKLNKAVDGWEATSEHEINGNKLRLTTYAHGNSPKTSCEVFKDGKWQWEFPHLFGYMLGFDVKADKRKIAMAHKRAEEVLEKHVHRLFPD